jgi:arylsulfatase A-like enzyme
MGLLLLAMLMVIALNWRNIGTYFFYEDFHEFDNWLMEVKRKAEAVSRPPSFAYIRQPREEGSDKVIRTVWGTIHPDHKSYKYEVNAKKGERIRVGVARIETSPFTPGEYVFNVYEMHDGDRDKLLSTSVDFHSESSMLFDIEIKSEQRNGHPREIEYVLESKGTIGKIISLFAWIRGLPPYYKYFAFLSPSVLPRREPDELNVIMVSFDTLRPDHLSCFGYPRPTSPNIDAFVEQGILFPQTISTSPWTGPAHYSLFTGLYPSAHLASLSNFWDNRVYTDRVIAVVLKEEGYYTIGVTGGAQVSSVKGFNRGFDYYLEFNRHYKDNSEQVFQNAMDWLEDNRDTKFFMFLHTYQCHSPYDSSYFIDREDVQSFIGQRQAFYDGDIREVDMQFGRFMEKLRSLELLSNTIIVAVSDHGEDLNDHFTEADLIPQREKKPHPRYHTRTAHGHSLYDELIKVFTVFHLPGFMPEKKVFDNQIRLIDIMPTILDYLNIEHDDPSQGTSLLELMRTGEREQDPPAISEFLVWGPEQKSVRMNGYKYIYTIDPDERRNDVTFRGIPQYALFDLQNDPDETNNIYEKNRKLAEQYHSILDETLSTSLGIKNRLEKTHQPFERDLTETPKDVADALRTLGYLN